jgi:Predicted nucleoside-diphosphate-sugar epimerases
MTKVLVLGANGQIARIVEERLLKEQPDVELTLFLRNSQRLADLDDNENVTLVDGDITDYDAVNAAMKGQDVVYIAMVDHTEDNVITKNVIKSMKEIMLIVLLNQVCWDFIMKFLVNSVVGMMRWFKVVWPLL